MRKCNLEEFLAELSRYKSIIETGFVAASEVCGKWGTAVYEVRRGKGVEEVARMEVRDTDNSVRYWIKDRK